MEGMISYAEYMVNTTEASMTESMSLGEDGGGKPAAQDKEGSEQTVEDAPDELVAGFGSDTNTFSTSTEEEQLQICRGCYSADSIMKMCTNTLERRTKLLTGFKHTVREGLLTRYDLMHLGEEDWKFQSNVMDSSLTGMI